MPEQTTAGPLWTYRARVLDVVDGDTLDVTIDAGFRSFREERLRLLGVNAPEVRGPTRPAGLAATEYVRGWLAEAAINAPLDDWSLIVQTAKSDVFGRYLATVWRMSDGRCLNEDLIEAGHAVVDIRALPKKEDA